MVHYKKYENLNLLEKSKLKANQTDQAVALVKRVALRQANNQSWYLSVLLKDIHGKNVYGCLFEVEINEGLQREIEALTDRPAMVRFKAQYLRESTQLHLEIEDITPLDPLTAADLERVYFKSAYPAEKFQSAIQFTNIAIDAIGNESLRGFVKTHCKLQELEACSDPQLYDGMLGASAGIISGMLMSASAIVSSQPGFLTDDDRDILYAMIVFLEFIYAKTKPLYRYKNSDWYQEMIMIVSNCARISQHGDSDKSMTKFFKSCQAAVWHLADVQGTITTVGQIFLSLHKGASICHRVVNITNEIPEDAIVTIGNKTYAR